MEKAIIKYNNPEKEDEGFHEKFINHLKSGKKFEIYDAVVEGNIEILEIYKIYESIPVEERNKIDYMKVSYSEQFINIDIYIDIYIDDVEFKGMFKAISFDKYEYKIIFVFGITKI